MGPRMAFRVIKQRREARRLVKMEELFAKHRVAAAGEEVRRTFGIMMRQEGESILVEEVAGIFRVYGVDYKEVPALQITAFQ